MCYRARDLLGRERCDAISINLKTAQKRLQSSLPSGSLINIKGTDNLYIPSVGTNSSISLKVPNAISTRFESTFHCFFLSWCFIATNRQGK